jgi:hypothetical protein
MSLISAFDTLNGILGARLIDISLFNTTLCVSTDLLYYVCPFFHRVC